jgi:hypothetical protein
MWDDSHVVFGQKIPGEKGSVSHVVFGQKIPGEKGSVRQCIVVMQQLVLSSPKFGGESSHIFMQSP